MSQRTCKLSVQQVYCRQDKSYHYIPLVAQSPITLVYFYLSGKFRTLHLAAADDKDANIQWPLLSIEGWPILHIVLFSPLTSLFISLPHYLNHWDFIYWLSCFGKSCEHRKTEIYIFTDELPHLSRSPFSIKIFSVGRRLYWEFQIRQSGLSSPLSPVFSAELK